MFLCEVCGKSFLKHIKLTRHVRTVHSKSFLTTCNICKIELKRKDNMKRHMNIHNQEKNDKNQLLCEICGLCFNSMKMMQEHLTKHRHTPGKIQLFCYIKFEKKIFFIL